MQNFLTYCSDRIREQFISNDELADQSMPFLERFYARRYPHLKKLAVGECEDVYLSANTRDSRFNTNIKAHLGTLDEMYWGFKGTGPHTLALNILYTFTGDSLFSRVNAIEFREEFLEKIDSKKSYWLPSFMILNWIEKKQQEGFAHVQ